VGNYLLHHPLVQLYLLFVGALAIAFLRDSLRLRRRPPGGDAPAGRGPPGGDVPGCGGRGTTPGTRRLRAGGAP